MKPTRIYREPESSAPPPPFKPELPHHRLVFAARPLLTEKSSVTVTAFVADPSPVAITIHAGLLAGLGEDFSGYSHFGIND
ncbi:MAG: hypothetical protein WCS42_05975 [Verrucomicrobiota bacterium]